MKNTKPRSDNQLLACLPLDEWQRLEPLMKEMALPAGKSLYESGSHFEHVYFPLSGLVALHSQVENGDSSVLSLVWGVKVSLGSLASWGGCRPRATQPFFLMAFFAHTQRRFAAGIRTLDATFALVITLHTSTHHSNGANLGLQPTPQRRRRFQPLLVAGLGQIYRQ